MKHALVLNAKTGKPEQLTACEALNAVASVDPLAMTRFVKLNTAVGKNNNAMYEIASALLEINDNNDSILYGYKTTADMVENMFGYKKSSTSKMLAVARNFLVTEKDGKIKSVFCDKFTDGNDLPMTGLYELLHDKATMKLRGEKIIEFYNKFPLQDMKQMQLRELKQGLSDLIKAGLPLTEDAYNELTMQEQDDTKEHNKPENEKVSETQQNDTTNDNKPDSVEMFRIYVGSIGTMYIGETNPEKRSEMRKLLDSVLKKITEFDKK